MTVTAPDSLTANAIEIAVAGLFVMATGIVLIAAGFYMGYKEGWHDHAEEQKSKKIADLMY